MDNKRAQFEETLNALDTSLAPDRQIIVPGNKTVEINLIRPILKQKKRERAGILSAIAAGAALIIVLIIAIIANLPRTSYGETYTKSKELNESITSFLSAESCKNIVTYAAENYPSEDNYNLYIIRCRRVSENLFALIDDLENTEGAKENAEISEELARFKSAFFAVVPEESAEDLETAFTLYSTWHKFVVDSETLTMTSSEADYNSVAAPLINSNNADLSAFGTEWLSRRLQILEANANYHNASTATVEQYEYIYNRRVNLYETWLTESGFNIEDTPIFNFDTEDDLLAESEKLHALISTIYEQNYEYGSGNCIESENSVECD